MASLLRTLRGRLGRIRRALRRHLSLAPPPDPITARRAVIAAEYLRGTGIEIGALHKPLSVPETVRVKYVDRMRSSQLREHYPELSQLDLVDVEIVDDGELLTTIPDASQDFVIANHFIEHCQDPIRMLMNHFRVLRPGGIFYLAVPDKRFTFDKDRPVTPISHVYRDHEIGPASSRMQHFEEWVRHVNKLDGEDAVREQTKALMELDYSIHFHVWTQLDFLEFLLSLRDQLSFDIETMLKQGAEFVIVLRKTAGQDTA
jgi:predicted SAM-dependent methyltransferase